MSDIITNTTNTNDCKVFKVYLSKYTFTNISSNSVINNSTVNGINVTNALNNLQNSKLDKGSFVGTAQDLYDRFEGKIEAGYNCIPKVGNGASGKVLVDSAVSEINGKIGIGLGVEASEKLEVNGRVKSDGIVINETTSAILPKEIKFKDGKFKAALADGVEKAVLLEGSSPSTLIVRYKHNANLSYQPTAINYATGYITVENHVFTSTIPKFVGIFTNNMQILRTYNGTVFPYEWLNVPIFMKKIDNNTLMICNSSGNVIPVNPSSTQNLGKLDITKWHIEEFSAINLSEIPIGIFNIRIIIKGLGNNGTAVQNGVRYITLELYNSSGVFVPSPSYFNFVTNQQNQQDCNFVCVFDFYGKDVIPQIIGSEKYNNLAASGNYVGWANSNITSNIHTPLGVLGISGVKNPANYNWLGNGSVIEIYAL